MDKLSVSRNLANTPVERELKRLKQAADDFEQIFVNIMLKEMYKNVGDKGLLDGGDYQKMFKDMLIEERAKELSRSGNLGLAKQMYDQLKGTVSAQFSHQAAGEPGSSDLKGLAHQLTVERIANDYRRTKGNQK